MPRRTTTRTRAGDERRKAHLASPPPVCDAWDVSSIAVTVPEAERDLRVRALGIVVVAAVLFGMMAVLVRVACREMPPGQVTWIRFAGSFAVLLLAARGRSLRPSPGKYGRILLRGLLGACSISLYYYAIAEVGAGLATRSHHVVAVH